jgi:hypothetical protein
MTVDAQNPEDPAGATRLPMVMFGLRAAALAGLAVATGLGAADLAGDVAGNVLAGFDADVTTTTCCMNEH